MAKHRGERQVNPGAELRAICQQLGWSMREVHAVSGALAKKRRKPAFVIPPSRLHDIESTNKVPSIHRLYALALINGRTLNELLIFVRNSIVTLFRKAQFVRFSEQPRMT